MKLLFRISTHACQYVHNPQFFPPLTEVDWELDWIGICHGCHTYGFGPTERCLFQPDRNYVLTQEKQNLLLFIWVSFSLKTKRTEKEYISKARSIMMPRPPKNRDVASGILYFCGGAFLLTAQWLDYSQSFLSFVVPLLVLCMCHWVAIRIYLRRWALWDFKWIVETEIYKCKF